MKSKKIILMVLSIFVSLIFINNVSAKVTCEYEHSKTGLIIELEFEQGNLVYYNDGKEQNLNNTKTDFNVLNESDCPRKIKFDLLSDSDNIIIRQTNDSDYNLSLKYNNKVSCGNVTEIPRKIPELTNMAITIIQVAIPVILVIMGMIDFFKAMSAQKEEEVKKGQKLFVKRLIVAAIIFFVIVIVKLLISLVAETSSESIVDCIDCFLSGVKNCSK